jgi:hypothetical protein
LLLLLLLGLLVTLELDLTLMIAIQERCHHNYHDKCNCADSLN